MADDPYATIAHDPYANIAAPAKSEGESPLSKVGEIAKKAGEALGGGYRNLKAAQTSAARDPVGALGNVLGAAEGGIAGGVMAPIMEHNIGAFGRGVVGGVTDPKQRDKYNTAFGDLMFKGARPQGDGMPARVGRGAEDLALQTMVDPVTHGGAAAMGGLVKGGKAVGEAAAKGLKPLGNYVTELKEAVNDPRLAPAIAKVAHVAGKATSPLRGIVDAGKDLLFMNPFPHGIGNMTFNNFLKNGPGTAAKGLRYGVTGAPEKTVADLERMKAGAYTPELLDTPSPWGPVGWMDALGKKGVPAAVRGGAGATAGGAIANQTGKDTDTPLQRAQRIAEGSLLGGLTGASPEVLNASNKIMSRLETGHRAAMLENMPKAAEEAVKKPHFTAADVAKAMKRKTVPDVHGPATINSNPFSISPHKTGRIMNWPVPTDAATKIDPRGAQINAVFGGGEKSPVAKIATSLGGPFAAWQADVVPRVVGGALKNAPARVESVARAQDITNRDVLKDQPYKLATGGPVGGFSEMLFNTPKYASKLLGPLGGVDPNESTNPKTFSAEDKLKDFAYDETPGREVVGPFFGDSKYKSKAPAIPSAALSTALGWNLKNKTPGTDAILQIMKSTGLNQQQAAHLYERYKR